MCSTPYGIRGLGTGQSRGSASRMSCECSTPYGIRGLGTAVPSEPHPIMRLCSTPYGIRGLGTKKPRSYSSSSFSAQRLTASEVWAQKSKKGKKKASAKCSTPYGIRGLGTLADLTPVELPGGCSTPYGIRGLGTSGCEPESPISVLCSTPYGIRGLGTRSNPGGGHAQVVLNALRHQRFGHALYHISQRYGLKCSTPYGIRGLGTARRDRLAVHSG